MKKILPNFTSHSDVFEFEHMDEIKTHQTHLSNQEFEWLGEDTEVAFEQNLNNPDKKKKLETFGWTTSNILYKINQHGFRDSGNVDPENCFCVFGDSFTFGQSIAQEDIFADIISKKISISYYNFGIGGGSDDTAVRLALTWLKKIKPKFVIWQKTFKQRFEVIEQDMHGVVYGIISAGGGQIPRANDNFYKSWCNIESNQDLQRIKNTATMRILCQDLLIPLFEIDNNEFFFGDMDRGRDLLHPGRICHQRIAEKFLELYYN